uniref:Uncharacterized protein n=1 Tax=Aegilops tauschii subsp. strangulata TaxID=200361 RepID=A0A453R3J4_AEGTS
MFSPIWSRESVNGAKGRLLRSRSPTIKSHCCQGLKFSCTIFLWRYKITTTSRTDTKGVFRRHERGMKCSDGIFHNFSPSNLGNIFLPHKKENVFRVVMHRHMC